MAAREGAQVPAVRMGRFRGEEGSAETSHCSPRGAKAAPVSPETPGVSCLEFRGAEQEKLSWPGERAAVTCWRSQGPGGTFPVPKADFLIKLLLQFLFCVQPEGNERPSKEKTFPCFSLPKTSGKERMAAQPERHSPRACSSYSLGKAGADPKSTQLFLGGFLVHRGSTGCSPLIHKMSHHPTKFAPFPRVS